MGEDVKVIEIYGFRTEQRGKAKFKFYDTSIGELAHAQLARALGITPSLLSKRISEHGLKSPEVTQEYNRKVDRKGKAYPGKPQWEGLSGKSRAHKLKGIKDKSFTHYLSALGGE